MKKKTKLTLFFLALLLVVTVASLNSASAANVCCERLADNGAWCQVADESECDAGYLSQATTCDNTNFCSVGTCVSSVTGTCSEEVTQSKCNDEDGFWYDRPASEIAQCQKVCCLLGEGAQYVSQKKCEDLSARYGLETLTTEASSALECLASAGSDQKGACVYESGATKTCRMLTKAECNNLEGTENQVNFFDGKLCSAEELGTNCGPTEETTCVPGEDEVYFVDSCGNLANIYDASKINDQNYWSEIIEKQDSCNPTSTNAGSTECGNCNYFSTSSETGSTCKAYERGETKPTYGDYICKPLSCEYDFGNGMETLKTGEKRCAVLPGAEMITDPDRTGEYPDMDLDEYNLPGSTYATVSCFNGEIVVENCDPSRQTVCVESTVGGITNAQCKINDWKECFEQKNKETCEDRTLRDCVWDDTDIQWTSDGNTKTEDVPADEFGYCYPRFAPGFDFWANEGAGETYCHLGDFQLDYTIEQIGLGDPYIGKGSEFLTEQSGQAVPKKEWVNRWANMCASIGDCGIKNNFLGEPGDYYMPITKVYTEDEGESYHTELWGIDGSVKVDGVTYENYAQYIAKKISGMFG